MDSGHAVGSRESSSHPCEGRRAFRERGARLLLVTLRVTTRGAERYSDTRPGVGRDGARGTGREPARGTSVHSTIRRTYGSTRVASPPSPLTPRASTLRRLLSQREVPFLSPRSLFPFERSRSSPLARSIFQTRARATRARARAHTVLPILSFLSFRLRSFHLRRRRGVECPLPDRRRALRAAGRARLRRGISTPFRRTSNVRSYAVGRAGARPWRKQFTGLLKRPSARRGPGIVSVDRNVRSKCRCSCVLQFTS